MTVRNATLEDAQIAYRMEHPQSVVQVKETSFSWRAIMGTWTVTSWNRRAIESRAEPREVYRGPSREEAIRIFTGLSFWKRKGIVEMVSPGGTVSTTCRTGDPSTSWETFYAHTWGLG